MTIMLMAEKILELLFYVFLGFLFVKIGMLKRDAAGVLSTIILFLLNPFISFAAFQIDGDKDFWISIIIGIAIAITIHIILIVVSKIYARFINNSPEEMCAIVYSNCGNLMLPILIMFFGDKAAIYTLPYSVVFTFFSWTHGVRLFNPEKNTSIFRNMINPNIIAMVLGAAAIILGIRLPHAPLSMIHTMGDMLGPLAMIMVGIVMGYLKFDLIKTYKRLPLVIAIRMLICPSVVYAIYYVTDIVHRIPQASDVLMVVLLSSSAPVANIVAQFSVMYKKDAEYASALNVVSTLLCLITMPMWLYLYQLLQ